MQITKHIHAIKISFQIKLPGGTTLDRFVYVYLIYGDNIYLIDSGVASGKSMIFDYIQKTGRSPDDISLVLLTHSHPDHIGAAKAIKEKTGCEIAAHQAEKNWIENVELQAKERPVPGFRSLVEGSVRVDRILNDGDVIGLGKDLELNVLHTPGHSQGSISLLYRKDMVLFSGDSIFIPGEIPIYENVMAAANSIKKLKSISGLKFLLSSWDEPKKGKDIIKVMDRGLNYLQQIHTAIKTIAKNKQAEEPMVLCKKVVCALNLPPAAVNPLVSESFQSNIKVLDKNIL